MSSLQEMRAFVSVVECGSFSKAAQRLHVCLTTASRSISRLEARLNIRLLHRNSRRLVLTESGRRFFEQCKNILFQVDEAEAEARAGLEVLTGVLRIRSIMGAGSRLLMPAIANCRKKHPQVRFDLSAGKRMPNFIEEDIDLAILIADHLEDSANVCQRLGVVSSILCASPDYVERFGSPRTPGEILKHESLLLGTPDNAFNRWRFSVDDKDQQTSCRMAHMEVDTLDDLMSALEAGMGVGMLPECIANKAITQGSLTRILPEYTSDLTVYAVYPSKRYLDPKVKALIDCTRSLLSQ